MKTVIFDFDGTIADSFDTVIKIVYLLTKSPKLVDAKEIERLRKMNLIDIAVDIKLPKYKWPYLFIKGRYMINKYISQVKPYPDIGALLQDLHKKGYALYILSSNRQKNIKQFLISNDFNSYFTKIYTGIGLWGKTRAFKQILNQNNLVPGEVIYIANEPSDIEAAKANEIKCIAISWGTKDQALLESCKPFMLANTPSDILKAVEKWDS